MGLMKRHLINYKSERNKTIKTNRDKEDQEDQKELGTLGTTCKGRKRDRGPRPSDTPRHRPRQLSSRSAVAAEGTPKNHRR